MFRLLLDSISFHASATRFRRRRQSRALPIGRIELLEPRLFLSSTLEAAATGDPALTTDLVQALSAAAASKLTVTATGFSIDAGPVKSTSERVGIWGRAPVSPVLSNGTLVYAFVGWTIAVTPTEDADGIHFAIKLTNTGLTPSVAPDFTLAGLTGGLTPMWASNQSGPFILQQTLADGTQLAFTIDDPGYPMVAELMQATNPYNGKVNIYFHPSGGQYTRYNLGLDAIRLQPGESTSFRASLRFGPDRASISAATYAAWRATFPYALNWTDHRMMLRGDMFQYDPTTANPQGFQGGFDINNPANGQRFDDWVMAYAARNIASAKAANAGTWIEWDLEGKQGGFNYKGNPSLIDVLNSGWAHKDASGVPLVDRFFLAFKDAGIHVGVCLRPWTLGVDGNGNLFHDTSISGVQSVANQMDYAWNRWGVDVFYVDSPEQNQTAAYRKLMIERPHLLMIPEDVPEAWLQFSAPMVWWADNVINWQTVPRNLYGNDGWGVYFHQDLRNTTLAANFVADARRGSSVLVDGWMGTSHPEVQAAIAAYALADPPAIDRPATASTQDLAGTTVVLSTAGFDNSGESTLRYTWSYSGPGPVDFAVNGTNAAKTTSATFHRAGSYLFTATLTDSGGLSVSSSVAVVVEPIFSRIELTPTAPTVASDGVHGFAATGLDQFGDPIPTPMAFAWNVLEGQGWIDPRTGLYRAGFDAGTATIQATSGAISAAATITITNAAPTLVLPASIGSIAGAVASLAALGADVDGGGESNLTYLWSIAGTPPAAVVFGDNKTHSAKNTTATFSAAGSYDVILTVIDAGGQSTSSTVKVEIAPAATTKLVSSSTKSIYGQPVTFTATVAPVTPGKAVPTGVVRFMSGTKLLGTATLDAFGRAIFTTSLLDVGDHSITATFIGSEDYLASTSAALKQTVSRVIGRPPGRR